MTHQQQTMNITLSFQVIFRTAILDLMPWTKSAQSTSSLTTRLSLSTRHSPSFLNVVRRKSPSIRRCPDSAAPLPSVITGTIIISSLLRIRSSETFCNQKKFLERLMKMTRIAEPIFFSLSMLYYYYYEYVNQLQCCSNCGGGLFGDAWNSKKEFKFCKKKSITRH